jgi:hypothetical protein
MDPTQIIIAGGGIEVSSTVYKPLIAYAKSFTSVFQWSFYIDFSSL